MNAPKTSQAMTAPAPATKDAHLAVSGTFSDKNQVTAMLERRGRDFHLVSPTTECSVIPEGCGISFAAVLIDIASETYQQEGKQALHRVALDRIAAAAGISWDARASGRIDNGKDPHYCLYRAVGCVRQFDGTLMWLPPGTKEMDLREGSQVALTATPKDLAMQRKHIVSHAETKARLRAIASLGVRRSYTKEELSKPFVCAKLSFTGETNDPELRRAFALKRADAFLGASQGLYGAPPSLPESAPMAMGIAPPPVGESNEDAELETGPDVYDSAPAMRPTEMDVGTRTTSETRQATSAAAAPPQVQQRSTTSGASSQRATPTPPQRPRSGLVIPGGRSKGTPLETADEKDLAYWSGRIGRDLDEGTSRFPDKDRVLCDAMLAELDWRVGATSEPQDDDFPRDY